MQKVVLFIEPSDDAFMTPEKIGQLFMNRIAVDEDASFEILDTYKIEKTSHKISRPNHPKYANFENERKEKGMGLESLSVF